MEGTRKQVEWAEDIRDRRMNELDGLDELVKAAPDNHPAKVALTTIRDHYETANDASWWIDHDQTTTNVKIMANSLAKGRKACGDGRW